MKEVSKKLGLPGFLSATEASQIARDITLAKETGVHYHVCHVSTEESVRVIRDAKKQDSRNSRSFATPFNFSR